MAEQLHQGVDADVGIGEFGGERMAQSVDKCAACAVGIDAGATEGARDAVLHDAAGDAVSIGTHKQRRRRRPGGQSPAGEERCLAVAGNRVARLSRYSSMTSTSAGSIGTRRSLPPLPRT